jgi:NHL repeat
MMFSRQNAQALLFLASAVALAACSSPSSSQYGPAYGAANRQAASLHPNPIAIHVDRAPHPLAGTSWFDHRGQAGPLLYISDYNLGVVYTYSFPNGKMVGALYGMGQPRGMCVDNQRNIWITDNEKSKITKYAHGGINPIATLRDRGNAPVGCAFDKRTGDLAVANINATDGGPGSITIYRYATGKGRNYQFPNFANVDFLDYDHQGNLFFDGQDASGAFELAELSNGKLTSISVSGATINFPGGVQFDGRTLTVGDQATGTGYSIVYRMTPSGTVTGKTNLKASADCVQYFVTPYSLICPNAGGPNAQTYHWPKGGKPVKTLSGTFDLPIGSVISQ